MSLPPPPPLSLSKLVRDHFTQQLALRDEIERLKKATIKGSAQVADEMVSTLNEGVSAVFSNQTKLEAEAKRLQQNTSRLVKQSNQWLQLGNQLDSALKDLGDVQAWIRGVTADMKLVADCLTSVAETNLASPSPAASS